MKKIKHYTIPIFIPEKACPHRCIFCNQQKISGHIHIPTPQEAEAIVKNYLKTLPQKGSHIEIGFLGGNFTGIPDTEQEVYLKIAQSFVQNGTIHGIRISTRPDYIDVPTLQRLKKYGVHTIELGAQSMHPEVLQAAGRGHTPQDVSNAAYLIRKYHFSLGLQMMIGLPNDSRERSLETARQIIALGADNTRIYPCLVIKDTPLANLYQQGKYHPLSMDEAIGTAALVYKLFETHQVNIIRVGLHPSEGLLSGNELVDGPFHPSFRELVLTQLWSETLAPLCQQNGRELWITVAPGQENVAAGHKGINRRKLETHFSKIHFNTKPSLSGRQFHFRIH